VRRRISSVWGGRGSFQALDAFKSLAKGIGASFAQYILQKRF